MTVLNVPISTADPQAERIAALSHLFPEAFPDGGLDVQALLTALDAQTTPGQGFAFSWPGIDEARALVRAPTTATLEPDEAASLDWLQARDVLIEGDNLQVLKLLKRGYREAFKLIYIDPPYNTGKTFTYNDKFAISEPDYLKASGQVDASGAVISSKSETVGRKHAPWLNFMLPRLVLARQLLRRDGVFCASIDNNEVHHLRLLLDAAFGAANFVDMLTWQGGRKGDARFTASGQDYILIYARDKEHLKSLDVRWRERKTGLEEVYAFESYLLDKHGTDFDSAKSELREWYANLPEGNPAKQHSHYNHIDKGGVWTSDNSSSPNPRPNLKFEYKGYSPPENGWRYDQDTMAELDAKGKLLYPADSTARIRIKKYLREQENWAPSSTFYRDRSAASSQVDDLVGEGVFDNPKNTDVLARLFSSMTGDGDLILDFFAGSGSTGHAVWNQNKLDGKKRRWVLVQAPEELEPSDASGKAALAAGYQNIFDITSRRLRAAAALSSTQIDGTSPGFRIFRTRPTNLEVEAPFVAGKGQTAKQYLATMIAKAKAAPVRTGAQPTNVVWEAVLKSTATRLDATVTEVGAPDAPVLSFTNTADDSEADRLFVCMSAFSMESADQIGLKDGDTLILRGDVVADATVLTLAPRLKSKLILLERVPREVSL